MESSQFDFCNDPGVLQIFYIIRILFKLLGYIIPIVLIVLVSIDLIKGISSNKKGADEVLPTALRRIVSAVIVFFIPIIANLSLDLLKTTTIDEYVRGEADNYKPTMSSCWTGATKEGIAAAKVVAEFINVRELEIINDEIQLLVGKEYILVNGVDYNIIPTDATDKGISYSSNNETVAEVTIHGKIIANSSGDAVITLSTNNGNHTGTIKVKVVRNFVCATNIGISNTSLTLTVGDTKEVSIEITPNGAINNSYSYFTSNNGIISVTINTRDNKRYLNITGVSEGETSLTIKDNEDSSCTASNTITVKVEPLIKKVADIQINALDQSMNLYVGDTKNIRYMVIPSDATNKVLSFSSNDSSIASVNQNGSVTGKAAGTTTITIKATDGSNVTSTITVVVSNRPEGQEELRRCYRNFGSDGLNDVKICDENFGKISSPRIIEKNNSNYGLFREITFNFYWSKTWWDSTYSKTVAIGEVGILGSHDWDSFKRGLYIAGCIDEQYYRTNNDEISYLDANFHKFSNENNPFGVPSSNNENEKIYVYGKRIDEVRNPHFYEISQKSGWGVLSLHYIDYDIPLNDYHYTINTDGTCTVKYQDLVLRLDYYMTSDDVTNCDPCRSDGILQKYLDYCYRNK